MACVGICELCRWLLPGMVAEFSCRIQYARAADLTSTCGSALLVSPLVCALARRFVAGYPSFRYEPAHAAVASALRKPVDQFAVTPVGGGDMHWSGPCALGGAAVMR